MRPRVVRAGVLGLRVGVGLILPTALYYELRALGTGVYPALVASAVVSAAPGVVGLVRERRMDGLTAYLTTMMLGALAVGLLPGNTRFLLAKDALLTGVTGVWFLAGIRARRPLAYLFTRPLLEGRFRWPRDWEQVWAASPRFRRMWRVSSSMYGVGLLLDAVLRVRFAYTLPPDAVPGASLALYAATTVTLMVVTNAYYVVCRVQDPRSPLRREARRQEQGLHSGVPSANHVVSTLGSRVTGTSRSR